MSFWKARTLKVHAIRSEHAPKNIQKYPIFSYLKKVVLVMPAYKMTMTRGKKNPRIACQNITTLKCVYYSRLFITFIQALMILATTMMIVPETIDSFDSFASFGPIVVMQIIRTKQMPIAKNSTARIFSSLSRKARMLVQKGDRLNRIEARAIGMFSRDHV